MSVRTMVAERYVDYTRYVTDLYNDIPCTHHSSLFIIYKLYKELNLFGKYKIVKVINNSFESMYVYCLTLRLTVSGTNSKCPIQPGWDFLFKKCFAISSDSLVLRYIILIERGKADLKL